MNVPAEPLLSVRDVTVEYPGVGSLLRAGKRIRAVDRVSLDIVSGETLGLVGESGSGKSSLGRAIIKLTRALAGSVFFHGEDLLSISDRRMRELRRDLQIIFQDPYSSLDPRMTVRSIVSEPLHNFKAARSGDIEQKVNELLESVGLSSDLGAKRPAEFSGGQRQRIGIARALAAGPSFIVADEPVSSLDVSIQAQVINLLRSLQIERGLTYLFISHDLRVVRYLSDRIAVMYRGRIVELGGALDVCNRPLMPYSQALVGSITGRQGAGGRQTALAENSLKGPSENSCVYRERCAFSIPECHTVRPELLEKRRGQHAACIRISPEHPDIAANARAAMGMISK